MQFERPDGEPAWSAPWFKWFASQLELPEGGLVQLEGHHLLIIDELFATGRVELLVMLPKGNGKTTLMAALAIWHLLTVRNANCYIGAADKIQADEMYRFAAHFVDSEDEISDRLKVLRGTREIRSMSDQGFIRVLASDDSKQGGKRQGFNPTLALIDELHAHENDHLYTDMRSGLFKRMGVLVTITTAGWDEESTLGLLRRKFLATDTESGTVERGLRVADAGAVSLDLERGRLTICRTASGNSAMLEWASREEDDIDDMALVKLANPSSVVTIASLEDARESLAPAYFSRYRANRWTLWFESWIPSAAWDALLEEGCGWTESGEPIAGLVDMGRYRDTAALAGFQPRPDLPAVLDVLIWRPGGHDEPVPYETVKGAIREVHFTFRYRACGFDPKYFDQAGEELAGEGVPMEMWPQTNERVCPAWANLRQAILEGAKAVEEGRPEDRPFVHNGDSELRAHMLSGVVREIGDQQFKLVKSKSNGPPIDAAVATNGAYALLSIDPPKLSADVW